MITILILLFIINNKLSSFNPIKKMTEQQTEGNTGITTPHGYLKRPGGIRRNTMKLLNNSDVGNIAGAYQLFESAAKKQKDLRRISKYSNMYDSIMTKRAEGLKFLQDSVDLFDKGMISKTRSTGFRGRSPANVLRTLARKSMICKRAADCFASLKEYTESKGTRRLSIKGKYTTPEKKSKPLKVLHVNQCTRKESKDHAKDHLAKSFLEQTPMLQSFIEKQKSPEESEKPAEENVNFKIALTTQKSVPNLPSSSQLLQSNFKLRQNEKEGRDNAALVHKDSGTVVKLLKGRTSERNNTPDFTPMYRTFVNYYTSQVSQNRRTSAGPLGYMASAHLNNHVESVVLDKMRYIRIYKRKRLIPDDCKKRSSMNSRCFTQSKYFEDRTKKRQNKVYPR